MAEQKKPKSVKKMTDKAVSKKNMQELSKMLDDPDVPEKLKAAAKRRLDVLSNQDKTATPVISIGVGLARKPAMQKGGMANGKEHMYSGGGSVTDKLNPGLRAINKTRSNVVKKILS